MSRLNLVESIKLSTYKIYGAFRKCLTFEALFSVFVNKKWDIAPPFNDDTLFGEEYRKKGEILPLGKNFHL